MTDSEFWNIQNQEIFFKTIEQPIYFNVAMLRTNPYGIHRSIYVNTTLKTKQITFKGDDYRCKLEGDGQMQHYNKKGGEITSFFDIDCIRIYGK